MVLDVVPDSEWQDAERRWITRFRDLGVDLTNLTDGGEGLHNASAETRAKLAAIREAAWSDPETRERLLNTLRSPERRAKISAALRGRKKSPEHVAKLPQNQPGWPHSPEWRAKVAESQRGRKHSPETLAKLSALNKGNRYGLGNRSRSGQQISEEERRKHSEALKGRPKSTEHREKIRQGALARWARQRAERDRHDVLEVVQQEADTSVRADPRHNTGGE